jgi:hypothetical protein
MKSEKATLKEFCPLSENIIHAFVKAFFNKLTDTTAVFSLIHHPQEFRESGLNLRPGRKKAWSSSIVNS